MLNDTIKKAFFLPLFSMTAALLAGCSAPAEGTDEPVARNATALEASADLTSAQAKQVLGLLDDACGDSWCEGDYSWQFPRIVCHFAEAGCTLTVESIDPAQSLPATSYHACKVHETAAYSDLVQTSEGGYASLVDGFRDQVSECIAQIESNLRAQ